MTQPLSSADHRALAKSLIAEGVQPWDFSEYQEAPEGHVAITRAIEGHTSAVMALVHAVLALGKDESGGFGVVERDDDGPG